MTRHSSAKSQKESRRFWENSEFCCRLRGERARLGLNQTDFAALGGAALDSQSRYETGKHQPNAEYLARLADKGVDVIYLLTGRRCESPLLSRRATELLDAFDELEPALQDTTLTMVAGLRDGASQPRVLRERQTVYRAGNGNDS